MCVPEHVQSCTRPPEPRYPPVRACERHSPCDRPNSGAGVVEVPDPEIRSAEVRRAGQQCERIRQTGENVNGCRSETSEPERRRHKAPSQSSPQGGVR
jgi:hypothetical protein